mgnify:CR=1 FL=1
MPTDDIRVPDSIDVEKPSAARMYDYYLGGYLNFEADRQAAEQVLQVAPVVREIAVSNRAFLQRAVTYILEQGITQFLDIGSGVPTVGSVHELVQRSVPDGRVVYVDIDPVAIEHAKALLEDNPNVGAIQADARQPEQILHHPTTQSLLDFDQPIGILLVSLLHFLEDEAAFTLVQTLRETMARGSYLALSRVTSEGVPEEVTRQLAAIYARSSAAVGKAHTPDQIAQLFEGLEVVEPGIVWLPLWRPRSQRNPLLDEPERSMMLAGVGYKAVD